MARQSGRRREQPPLLLELDEARALMLAAQGLLAEPPGDATADDLLAMIAQLGVVQVDTINVLERSQFLVLWSRLGVYDQRLLDALLAPRRAIFEYWSHAASIIPMEDYRYYRPKMLAYAEHMYSDDQAWLANNPDVVQQTLDALRDRGPLASADFERPRDGRRAERWDWYGLKDSRRALNVLWTTGDVMVHSRRGSQRVYDLREHVLAEAFGDDVPADDDLPTADERLRYFVRRTVSALGVLTPTWLWDYFRLKQNYFRLKRPIDARGTKVTASTALLEELAEEGVVERATIQGMSEAAYVARERLPDLERLRAGDTPARTTLLSPFDSLIWDRARARALFGYEVCFEAYVLPEKRRYGYYCLAILHNGRLVGRLDAKQERAERRLLVRAVYLEPGVVADEALLSGLAGAVGSLMRFVGATAVSVERSEPDTLAPALAERLTARLAPGPVRARSSR